MKSFQNWSLVVNAVLSIVPCTSQPISWSDELYQCTIGRHWILCIGDQLWSNLAPFPFDNLIGNENLFTELSPRPSTIPGVVNASNICMGCSTVAELSYITTSTADVQTDTTTFLTTASPAITTASPLDNLTASISTLTGDVRPITTSGPEQVCIHFTSDNASWSYTYQPPWGRGSGTFGNLPNGRMCIPINEDPGGALFISTTATPAEGSTKFECQFLRSQGRAWCDVSLVDGYSLSMTCTSGDVQFGGDVNLWKQHIPCRDIDNDRCLNKGGGDEPEISIDAFFQPAISNGNKYCIYSNCSIFNWPVDQDLSCHISGGQD